MKHNLILFLIITILTLFSTYIRAQDFRLSFWGDSPQDVKRVEMGDFYYEDNDFLIYNNVYESGYKCKIVYIFLDGQLARGFYSFDEEHDNYDEYTSDFADIQSSLKARFGEGTFNGYWRNEKYKANIDLWGKAIKLGHLVLSEIWNIDKTFIGHDMFVEEGHIYHRVMFDNVELTARLNEIYGTRKTNDHTQLPKFSDYPVKDTFSGKRGKLDLEGNQRLREYKNFLTNAMKSKPNFAGKYLATYLGCGTACQAWVIINLETGKIIRPGLTSNGALYNISSRLFIMDPIAHPPNMVTDPRSTYYYVLENDELILIDSSNSVIDKRLLIEENGYF